MARNAPGKHFRKGLSLVELFREFPDDATAEAWFIGRRWPDGNICCPECGSLNVQTGAKHKTMPFRCREKACGKRFSVRTGTVMQSSNLGYQVWIIAMYMLTTNLKSVSSMKLHRDLAITQKSAWHLAMRIRKAQQVTSNSQGVGGGMAFEGPVEADESYFGGKERNKHGSKKRRQGRGSVGKSAVVGIKDRDTGKISAAHFEKVRADTLKPFIRARVRSGAQLFTDDAPLYKAFRPYYRHSSVNHTAGEYVRQGVHIQGVESFWAVMKRAYKGTFHKLSKKHLGRYVDEFSAKHNTRNLGTIEQMEAIADGMIGKRLRYCDLIADNGLDSMARPISR